jgi:GNAT superfamily N-acetyltransferase
MPHLRLVSPTHPAAAPLFSVLRREYHALYGPEVAIELDRYAAADFLPPSGAFLIVQLGSETIAGGALRRFAPGVGEIKRMWTAPAHRGRGHSRRVLAALEDAAVRRGYHTLRMLAGRLSVAAVRLYEASGYREIPAYYPEYAGDPRALYFEKRLDGRDHLPPDARDRGDVIVREMLEHHAFDARVRQAA